MSDGNFATLADDVLKTLLGESSDQIVDAAYNEVERAYEIMGDDRCFKMIADDDIDWTSVESLPQIMHDRIKRRDAHFPFSIHSYCNGKTTVVWQINPDGRYYMDEDGYGMTDDIEVSLIGSMDRKGKIVEKFKLL